MTESNEKRGLLDRLEEGPVICAEGYLFELERRGYLQAGAFVPEVVMEDPDVVKQLHREFLRGDPEAVVREALREMGGATAATGTLGQASSAVPAQQH